MLKEMEEGRNRYHAAVLSSKVRVFEGTGGEAEVVGVGAAAAGSLQTAPEGVGPAAGAACSGKQQYYYLHNTMYIYMKSLKPNTVMNKVRKTYRHRVSKF